MGDWYAANHIRAVAQAAFVMVAEGFSACGCRRAKALGWHYEARLRGLIKDSYAIDIHGDVARPS